MRRGARVKPVHFTTTKKRGGLDNISLQRGRNVKNAQPGGTGQREQSWPLGGKGIPLLPARKIRGSPPHESTSETTGNMHRRRNTPPCIHGIVATRGRQLMSGTCRETSGLHAIFCSQLAVGTCYAAHTSGVLTQHTPEVPSDGGISRGHSSAKVSSGERERRSLGQKTSEEDQPDHDPKLSQALQKKKKGDGLHLVSLRLVRCCLFFFFAFLFFPIMYDTRGYLALLYAP